MTLGETDDDIERVMVVGDVRAELIPECLSPPRAQIEVHVVPHAQRIVGNRDVEPLAEPIEPVAQ